MASCLGLASLVVSITAVVALQNASPTKNTTSGSHFISTRHNSVANKGIENKRSVNWPGSTIRKGLFSEPILNPDTGDTNDKNIHFEDMLPETSTEYSLDESSIVNPCVKPCVCSEFPETQNLIVNCSGKSLTSIPVNFPRNVTHLFLGDNFISKVLSLSFRNLSSLQLLDISFNNLSLMENRSFADLVNLKCLYLNNNHLLLSRKSFYPGILSPLHQLAVLNLKSNTVIEEPNFRYFDSEIGELFSLEELYIDGVSNATFGPAYSNLKLLTVIDFSGSSSLKHLSSDTFSSLTYNPVSTLNFSHCDLRSIHPNTFKPLVAKIDTLDLSYNQQLEMKNAGISFAGLVNSPIRRVFAKRIHQNPTLSFLHKEDLAYLKDTQLEELYLDNNTIAQIDSDLINGFPKTLRVFSISWNNIQTYKAQMLQLLILRKLEFFYGSYQEVYGGKFEPPNTTNRNLEPESSNYPDLNSFLERFPETGNISKSGMLTFNLPPNLTELYVSHTYKIRFSIPQMRLNAPKGKKADLSYNLLSRWKGPIMGLETLEELDLSGNDCYELLPGFFSHFRSLKDLRIGDNKLGPDLDEGAFQGLGNLQILSMHKNRLETITPGLFDDMGYLEVLDFSRNYIFIWNTRISHLRNLKLFDLTSNKLSSISKPVLDDLDEISQHTALHISLKGNPLLCNCDTLYFVEWLMNTEVRLLNAHSTYCIRENGNQSALAGQDLASVYNFLQIHCRTYTALMVVSSCIIFITICIVIGKVLHRYRWKLRYLYYMAVNTGDRTGYERLDGDDQAPFTFDAFVSYEDLHRDFVRLEMLPKLETEAGLKLCIDKRDFIPGFYIADNIMNAIQNSRKTVVLLSKQFLESKWCMYEFNMARMESIYSDRHSLLVVLMETIPVNQLPAEVLEILHSKSYITKTDDPDGMALFWRQLTAGIRLDKTGDVAVI